MSASSPRWTRATRARLHGARSPHPLDAPAKSPDVAWQPLLAGDRELSSVRREFKAHPGARPGLTAVRRSFDEGARPTKLVVEHELVRLALCRAQDSFAFKRARDGASTQALVDFWVASSGVPFVLDVLESPVRFNLLVSDLAAGQRLTIELARPSGAGRAFLPAHYLEATQLLVALRPHVFRLDDAAWKVARARAEKLRQRWSTSHLDDQRNLRALVFAFARESKWVDLQVKQLLGRAPNLSEGGLVLCSITEGASAMRVAKALLHFLPQLVAPFAFDVVESLGQAAKPVLTLALEGATPAQRRALQSALALL